MSILEHYCGSPFWDYNLTWNTTDPSLTECFQKTVLVWIPCSFLWLFSPLEIILINQYPKTSLDRNFLNQSKVVLLVVMIISQSVDFSNILLKRVHQIGVVPPVDVYTPVIILSTLVLCFILMLLMMNKGKHTSGILFLFWFLLTLCNSAEFVSFVRKAIKSHSIASSISFGTYCTFYCCCFLQLILSTFADVSPSTRILHDVEKRSPEETASVLSRLTLYWVDGFIWKGFRRPIVYEDLWMLNESNTTAYACRRFDQEWEKEKAKSGEMVISEPSFSSQENLLTEGDEPETCASITKALWRTFGPAFCLSTFLDSLGELSSLLSPVLLQLLIEFVENKSPLWHGILYTVLLSTSVVIITILYNEHWIILFNLELRLNSALLSAVYKKTLKISGSMKRTWTLGEIVNLMSIDVYRVSYTLNEIPRLIAFPLKLAIALFMMWNLIGIYSLIGVVVFGIIIPVNAYLTKCIEKTEVNMYFRYTHCLKKIVRPVGRENWGVDFLMYSLFQKRFHLGE